MIKFTILLRRKPGLTRQEFLDHHRRHVELFKALPDWLRNKVRRYTLCHPTGDQIPRLPEFTFDGVVELCFDDIGELATLMESREYQATIRPDEERFLNLARCEFFLGVETAVIP